MARLCEPALPCQVTWAEASLVAALLLLLLPILETIMTRTARSLPLLPVAALLLLLTTIADCAPPVPLEGLRSAMATRGLTLETRRAQCICFRYVSDFTLPSCKPGP